MSVFETFSKRQKRLANAGKQDVYQYDDLSNAFRVQVIHIWRSAIGSYYETHGRKSAAADLWDSIEAILTREYGVFVLSKSGTESADRCRNFVQESDAAGALDIIELSFRVIEHGVPQLHHIDRLSAHITQDAHEAIKELNERFMENGIGFQYIGGILVRLDSQFAHAEIVKPALALLNAHGFDGPADEFIHAFDHYRHGRHKEAVVEALKAFESTMKAICTARKWPYPSNATAKQLMEVLFDKGLVPSLLESHFTNLRVAMESGLPTLRNKTSGHGQGATPIQIPAHFAAYALHLAAANIVFLVETHKALP